MSIFVDIHKQLGSFGLKVHFEAENERVALLGASGCGKSMTLKCIAGVVRPDSGRIVVNGITLFDAEKEINLSPQKRRVGLLFQNYALFPNMTVRQNIHAVLSLRRDRANLKTRFESLLEKFRLHGLAERYPAQLSGGQQQRVALARIMASDPSVIMLDEPLSALDSYLRWQLEWELMHILEDFEGTTLYVSHNRDEVYRLCEKVCVINNGNSESVRPMEALFASPDTFASALLSGCKNYSRVERVDDYTLHAVDWNVHLQTHVPHSHETRYIGVRAHYIGFEEELQGENRFPCTVLRVTQNVFSTVITLLPEGAPSSHEFSRIRVEVPKRSDGTPKVGDRLPVVIRSEDIMLLRE